MSDASAGKDKDLPLDRALFDGHVQSVVMTYYQNERPPCGLAGKLDWHFHGAISRCIKAGAITGHPGEYTYFPYQHGSKIFHIILTGVGRATEPGIREPLPSALFASLRKNLISLRLPQIGISLQDFGGVTPEIITRHLKGVPLWIGP